MRPLMFSTLVLFSMASTAALADDPMQQALGGYVPVYVDNFDGGNYRGATKRDVCLPKASEIALRFQNDGATVNTIFRNEYFALYKVVTKNDQKLFVHCNQNGSLVIGWKADPDVATFLESATAIGISLQEKSIDAQSQPAPVPNNFNINNLPPADSPPPAN